MDSVDFDTIWAQMQEEGQEEEFAANPGFGLMNIEDFFADIPQRTMTPARKSSYLASSAASSSPNSSAPFGTSPLLQDYVNQELSHSTVPLSSGAEGSSISSQNTIYLPQTQGFPPDTARRNLVNNPVAYRKRKRSPSADIADELNEIGRSKASLPLADNRMLSPQVPTLGNQSNIHHPKPVRSIKSNLQQIQADISPTEQRPQHFQLPDTLPSLLFTPQPQTFLLSDPLFPSLLGPNRPQVTIPSNPQPIPEVHAPGSILERIQFLRDNPVVSFYNYKKGLEGNSSTYDKDVDRFVVAYHWLKDQHYDVWEDFIRFQPEGQTLAARQQKWKFWEHDMEGGIIRAPDGEIMFDPAWMSTPPLIDQAGQIIRASDGKIVFGPNWVGSPDLPSNSKGEKSS